MNGRRVSRRVVLKVLGASSVVSLAVPACGSDDAEDAASGFLSAPERRALDALANHIVPSEPGSPGGGDLGSSAFVERLLTAFDVDPPALFADGPYSGRAPFSDHKGGAGVTGVFPPNDFLRFRRIDRVTEKAWRIRLYGSKAVEGGAINDGLVPLVVGLRDLFKDGLRKAIAEAKAPIETLSSADLRDVFNGLDSDLQKAFIELVPQAVWGAPEYGGNPGLAGWKLVGYEGDTQPFGFSILDEATGIYHERTDAPLSTKDPRPDPAPLDEATKKLLGQVVAFTDGKVFP